MIRWTTPAFAYDTDIDLTGATVYVSFSQSGKLLTEKSNDDLIITPTQVIAKLTQDESGAFLTNDTPEKGTGYVQLRYVLENGVAGATKKAAFDVYDTIKNGVIEWTR